MGRGWRQTGNNYYEKGITGPEVMAVLDKSLEAEHQFTRHPLG